MADAETIHIALCKTNVESARRAMKDKHHLLIADDEPLSQFIYQELFADDFELELVDDGLACMASLSKRIPDALILDVSMPGMSGFEVCERVRGDSRYPRLPILLVSGNASASDRQKGLSLGADEYLSKPFPVFELKELLTRLLSVGPATDRRQA